MSHTSILFDGLDFPEALRWHDDRVWFSDFYQRVVMSASAPFDAPLIELRIPDQPSGLGWMPDGSLLVVAMVDRKILRLTSDGLRVHADLGDVAPFHLNDMVVLPNGEAVVGNFGFDVHGGAPQASTCIAWLSPEGAVLDLAHNLEFPNGMQLAGDTLLVSESFAERITSIELGADKRFGERSTWAHVPGVVPDGSCLDSDGALWLANADGPEVIRVERGGQILDRIRTNKTAFGCVLGGPKGRTLFVATCDAASPADCAGMARGAIETIVVDTPVHSREAVHSGSRSRPNSSIREVSRSEPEESR